MIFQIPDFPIPTQIVKTLKDPVITPLTQATIHDAHTMRTASSWTWISMTIVS